MARRAPAPSRRRSSAHAVILGLLLAGCARPAPAPRAKSAPAPACSWQALPVATWSNLPFDEPAWGARITSVSVEGLHLVPRSLVESAIESRAGSALDRARVRRDVASLNALEAFSDVSAETTPDGNGVALHYVVVERPLIGRVVFDGAAPDVEHALALHAGGIYDPARIERRARLTRQSLVDAGHLLARIEVRGCRPSPSRVDVLVRADDGPEFVVDRVVFDGAHQVSHDDLLAALRKGNGPDAHVNVLGRHYRAAAVAHEILYMNALYYDRGMVSVNIDPPATRLDAKRGTVTLVFLVREGPVYHLGRVRVTGKLVASAERYRALLGVRSGDRFDRARLMDGMDRIRKLEAAHGATNADVVPNSVLHPDTATIDLKIVIGGR
jgi:outer membrane protein insertion porin family